MQADLRCTERGTHRMHLPLMSTDHLEEQRDTCARMLQDMLPLQTFVWLVDCKIVNMCRHCSLWMWLATTVDGPRS